jgi:hypothetical protein
VGEGHVDALRVYGPDGNTALVTLKDSAPGGARQCKVCTRAFTTYSIPPIFWHNVSFGFMGVFVTREHVLCTVLCWFVLCCFVVCLARSCLHINLCPASSGSCCDASCCCFLC